VLATSHFYAAWLLFSANEMAASGLLAQNESTVWVAEAAVNSERRDDKHPDILSEKHPTGLGNIRLGSEIHLHCASYW